jgi:hypothetical protein
VYVVFDYVCVADGCERTEERLVRRPEMDKQLCTCGSKKRMVRLPAGTRTHFNDRKLKP